jgi:hypothetical protein
MAQCSQPPLSRRAQHRFRCISGLHHHRSAMRSVDRLQVQASSGSKDIGNQLVIITGGFGDAGTVLPMKGPTGVIHTMTTTAKAGKCTRDIGIMRITTMATGENTIMIATIMIMTVTSDFTATSRLMLKLFQTVPTERSFPEVFADHTLGKRKRLSRRPFLCNSIPAGGGARAGGTESPRAVHASLGK